MNPSIVTRKNFKLINTMLGGILDVSEALFVLEKLENMDIVSIETIIEKHPEDWLGAGDKENILTFWKEGDAQTRIEEIRKGFGNGAYI